MWTVKAYAVFFFMCLGVCSGSSGRKFPYYPHSNTERTQDQLKTLFPEPEGLEEVVENVQIKYLLKDTFSLPSPDHPFQFPEGKNPKGDVEVSIVPYILLFVGIMAVIGATITIAYLYFKGKQSMIGDRHRNKKDYLAEIQTMFEGRGKVVTIGKYKQIDKNVTAQIEENEKDMKIAGFYSPTELDKIKSQVIQNCDNAIYTLMYPTGFPRTKGSNPTAVSIEFNPFQKASSTYYYELLTCFQMLDEEGEFNFEIKEIIQDLEPILKNTETLNEMERIRKEVSKKNRSSRQNEIYMDFAVTTWVEDTRFAGIVNKALLFDFIKPALAEEAPEFYQNIFPGQAPSFYQTVLRDSFKYILTMNWAIQNMADENDTAYFAYIYVHDWLFEEAKYGERYRFATFQTAYITKDGAQPELICERLIPPNVEKGTLVKLLVYPKCQNCGVLSNLKSGGKVYKAIIPAYASMTYKTAIDPEFDAKKNKNVQEHILELDMYPTNLTADDEHWGYSAKFFENNNDDYSTNEPMDTHLDGDEEQNKTPGFRKQQTYVFNRSPTKSRLNE